jgi:hypothetical protein
LVIDWIAGRKYVVLQENKGTLLQLVHTTERELKDTIFESKACHLPGG